MMGDRRVEERGSVCAEVPYMLKESGRMEASKFQFCVV